MGWDGMETAAKIRQLDPNIEFVIITAYSDRARAEIVASVGAPDKLLFLRKPFDPEELTQFAVALTAKWDLAMREEQQRLSLKGVLEATPAAIFTSDHNCHILSWNNAAEKITGYTASQVIGSSCPLPDILQSADCEKICSSTELIIGSRELEIQNSTHERKTILLTVNTIDQRFGHGQRIGAFIDITERKKLERQVLQSQKMEAIGSLAGGIAHDLNNMLTPIIGFAGLLNYHLEGDEKGLAHLKCVEDSALKAAALVGQILVFSRKRVVELENIAINKLINDFSKMLRRLIREDIELRFDFDPELWAVKADRSQMEQIIMNLVVNARDALPNGGEIVITTKNQEMMGASLDSALPPGDRAVLLMVSDNGLGMDTTTASRVFDPFFTTKEVGKGTGLGLSTVFAIVEQHQGSICLETEQGMGSTFIVTLPANTKVTSASLQPEVPKAIQQGCESVLLVEDSPELLFMVKSILSHHGYQVTTATDGLEALEIFQEDVNSWDLLITDVIMPRLGGQELAQAARELQPNLPILFITGHTFDVPEEKLFAMKNTTLLRKPFSLTAITSAVRGALDERPRP